jgi:asparagine synthase (glutamine-hydrolysing)
VAASPEGVCFSSELRALLAAGLVVRDLCPHALRDYLAHGFVPAPRSVFRGVRKLTAAQCVTLDLTRPDRWEPRTYWHPSVAARSGGETLHAVEAFHDELDRSIRLRMEADVPLGAFLSGGLDSTTVVRSMSRSGPVATFTIGFPSAGFDETPYAHTAARHYGTAHHVEVLDPAEMLRVLPAIERHYDEPFADSSAIPTYMVSRLARRDVTVALSGDGGDELLCGYRYYRSLHQAGRVLDRMPRAAVELLSRSARSVYPESMRGYGLLTMLEAEDVDRFMSVWLDDYFLERLPRDHTYAPGAALQSLWERTGGRGVERMAAVDSQFYVPEDLMVKVDRASMAVSLEVRSPLLDHHLFDAAARIPLRLRFDGVRGKLPFRTRLAADLGAAFVDRRKSGFAVPLGAWFRGPLRDEAHQTLLDPAGIVSTILHRRDIEGLLSMHERGTRDQSPRLWRLFALQRWYRTFGRAPTVASR